MVHGGEPEPTGHETQHGYQGSPPSLDVWDPTTSSHRFWDDKRHGLSTF